MIVKKKDVLRASVAREILAVMQYMEREGLR